MPQNIPTTAVAVLPEFARDLRAIPPRPAPAGAGALAPSTFRVVTVRLSGGDAREGLLLLDGYVLVPADAPPFTVAEIEGIEETPVEQWPDFSITDPESAQRSPRGITLYDAQRCALFGPRAVDVEWRERSIAECHEDALEDNEDVVTYPEGLPAMLRPPTLVRVERTGLRVAGWSLSADAEVEVLVAPTSAVLWDHLLEQVAAFADDVTLRDLLRLLDLPPDVDAFVARRTLRSGDSFRPWVARAGGIPVGSPVIASIDDVALVELQHEIDHSDGGEIREWVRVVGRSPEHTEATLRHGWKPGEREVFWLSAAYLGDYLDHPVRLNEEYLVPMRDDLSDAWWHEVYRPWSAAGAVGDPPTYPYALRATKPFTLAVVLRALCERFSPSTLEERIAADPNGGLARTHRAMQEAREARNLAAR